MSHRCVFEDNSLVGGECQPKVFIQCYSIGLTHVQPFCPEGIEVNHYPHLLDESFDFHTRTSHGYLFQLFLSFSKSLWVRVSEKIRTKARYVFGPEIFECRGAVLFL